MRINATKFNNPAESRYPLPVRKAWLPLSLFILAIGGCATPVYHPDAPNTVIVVPGVGGDGPSIARVVHALDDEGDPDCLQVLEWGYHLPLFFINISDTGLHQRTEQRLALLITQWRRMHPGSRIVLIGHSAGCGVILGAMPRLDPGIGPVGPVILMAPAVSPAYDLSAALPHVNILHVFYSEYDVIWQGIGPWIFGLYDGEHGSGAGRVGFTASGLSPDLKKKLVEHPFQWSWLDMGNYGGHFGAISHGFMTQIIKPLIDAPTTVQSHVPL
jgi:hypothetical protein